MATQTPHQSESAGIWVTFKESPLAVKAIFGGVFVNRVGGFLNIFLVLYLIAEGHSASEAALGLGCYGLGGVVHRRGADLRRPLRHGLRGDHAGAGGAGGRALRLAALRQH